MQKRKEPRGFQLWKIMQERNFSSDTYVKIIDHIVSLGDAEISNANKKAVDIIKRSETEAEALEKILKLQATERITRE